MPESGADGWMGARYGQSPRLRDWELGLSRRLRYRSPTHLEGISLPSRAVFRANSSIAASSTTNSRLSRPPDRSSVISVLSFNARVRPGSPPPVVLVQRPLAPQSNSCPPGRHKTQIICDFDAKNSDLLPTLATPNHSFPHNRSQPVPSSVVDERRALTAISKAESAIYKSSSQTQNPKKTRAGAGSPGWSGAVHLPPERRPRHPLSPYGDSKQYRQTGAPAS